MDGLDLEMWAPIHDILAYFEMIHLHSDCVPEEMHGSLILEERIQDVLVCDVG